jgi:hypothetical protein
MGGGVRGDGAADWIWAGQGPQLVPVQGLERGLERGRTQPHNTPPHAPTFNASMTER